jgi:hypothetical protein
VQRCFRASANWQTLAMLIVAELDAFGIPRSNVAQPSQKGTASSKSSARDLLLAGGLSCFGLNESER